MTTLIQYGWTAFHDDQYNHYAKGGLSAARVTSVRGFRYVLITERGELEAEVSGRLLYGNPAEDIPRVGDWVLYADYDSTGYITDVLPRTNTLARREAGTENGKQVLACNIDSAFIVQGLDRDYNLMRLDRYVVQVMACGIRPVIILNKSDLADNAEDYVRDVAALKRDCPVLLCSTVTGTGIDTISSSVLEEFKTYVLVGSSGAGKSSIVNALMNREVQSVSEVSDFNQKGRHTTSTRDLFRLPGGSLIIDTPGMREFGMTSISDDSSADLFPEISKVSRLCRFNDCAHMGETGCAVVAAVNSGALDQTIYRSYVKLVKEQKRFALTASDKKRLARQAGKMVREAKDYRKRFKGGD
jgi:ribosome biogenesis GTPase